MATGCGDLECAPRRPLSFDVAEVEVVRVGFGSKRRGWGCRRSLFAVEHSSCLSQRRDHANPEAWHDRCFGSALLGKQECELMTACSERYREDASRRLNGSIQGELADHQQVRELAPGDEAARRENTDRDGQVERSAPLSHVGGCEVDRDAVRRKLESRISNRAPHTVTALSLA